MKVARALGACMSAAAFVAGCGGGRAQSRRMPQAPRPAAAPASVRARPVKPVRTLVLSNRLVAASWRVSNGKLGFVSSGSGARRTPAFDEPFVLTLADGRRIAASAITVKGTPRVEPARVDKQAPRAALHFAGRQIVVSLASPDVPGPVTWRAVLRDGASYWREELTVGPLTRALALRSVTLIDARAPGAQVRGSVAGSPVVAGDAFMGLEHPMSACSVESGRARCSLAQRVPIEPGHSMRVSAVVGLAEPGQMRRTFLAYLERERAHPYRPFLHYNSWYDIGYFTQYSAKDALRVIDAFGRELVDKRGVKLSSFLFDDGWDDHKSLWSFNDGFPDGFSPLKTEAAKYGAAPGVWLSPFGGYGKPRKQRLEYGKAQGFETNARGFALSGPVYYRHFRAVCARMIEKYGVNQFKFDGIGRATGVVPGSAFGSDFAAAIQLIRGLRKLEPDLFVNLTTGTWPSPFWLRTADSIWRGGRDHDFAGVGSKRQQWITYRDAQTYKNVVRRAPLFPLSSLMLHGIIYARHAKGLASDPGHDFVDEVRAYFGTGTELQELYVTPALLARADWDALAEAAKWAHDNADVLADTHWIGGDPAELQVYGHAAWNRRLGILVLRNPGDRPQSIDIDVARAFELPSGAPQTCRAHSPWRADAKQPAIMFSAGAAKTVRLDPFQVLTLDCKPVASGS